MQHFHIQQIDIKKERPIDGNTKIFALLGHDLSYSMSFHLHNAAFQYFQYNAIYVPFVFHKNPISFFRSLCEEQNKNIQGCNITTPYKSMFLEQELELEKDIHIPFVLSEEVQQTRSTNTLIRQRNRWLARNSDIEGFVQSVSHLDFLDRDILILGAGGVCKSVVYALRHRMNLSTDQNIYIYNRTLSKAQILAKAYDLIFIDHLRHWPHNKNSVIINCTSLGQGSQKTLLAFDDPRAFLSDQIVIDLVYHTTPLLQKARQDGATICDGLSMLIWQAAISFSWWTNTDIESCRDVMLASLSNYSKTFDV